jgi:hypothetical protein
MAADTPGADVPQKNSRRARLNGHSKTSGNRRPVALAPIGRDSNDNVTVAFRQRRAQPVLMRKRCRIDPQ